MLFLLYQEFVFNIGDNSVLNQSRDQLYFNTIIRHIFQYVTYKRDISFSHNLFNLGLNNFNNFTSSLTPMCVCCFYPNNCFYYYLCLTYFLSIVWYSNDTQLLLLVISIAFISYFFSSVLIQVNPESTSLTILLFLPIYLSTEFRYLYKRNKTNQSYLFSFFSWPNILIIRDKKSK